MITFYETVRMEQNACLSAKPTVGQVVEMVLPIVTISLANSVNSMLS